MIEQQLNQLKQKLAQRRAEFQRIKDKVKWLGEQAKETKQELNQAEKYLDIYRRSASLEISGCQSVAEVREFLGQHKPQPWFSFLGIKFGRNLSERELDLRQFTGISRLLITAPPGFIVYFNSKSNSNESPMFYSPHYWMFPHQASVYAAKDTISANSKGKLISTVVGQMGPVCQIMIMS